MEQPGDPIPGSGYVRAFCQECETPIRVRWHRNHLAYRTIKCEDCATPGVDRQKRSMAAHYSRSPGQKVGMGKTTQ